MLTHKKLILALFSIVLLVAGYIGTRPQKCADGVCTTHAVAELPFSITGSYAVGSRMLRMPEEPQHVATLWYPAIASDEPRITYPYQFKLPVVGMATIATDEGLAVSEAEGNIAAGPYPLVILSPGFAMSASSYGWLAEHVASHGFVVLAPEHDEQLNPETDLWQGAVKRPFHSQALLA